MKSFQNHLTNELQSLKTKKAELVSKNEQILEELKSIDEYESRLLEKINSEPMSMQVNKLDNERFAIMFNDSTGITLTRVEAERLYFNLQKKLLDFSDLLKDLLR